MLRFQIPANARWRLFGSSNFYQRVIDTAISQGGIQQNFVSSEGYRVIVFSTGGRARWGNGYFGSLDNYQRNVRIYWN